MWKAFLNHFLRQGVMLRRKALDKSHGPAKRGDVAFKYALYKLGSRRERLPTGTPREIRVDYRGLGHAAVD